MRTTLSLLMLILTAIWECSAFTVPLVVVKPTTTKTTSRMPVTRSSSSLEDDEDDGEREYARVRSRGGRREREEDTRQQGDGEYDDDRRQRNVYDNQDWIDYDRLDDLLDDDDVDDEDEEYDMLSNVLIPNPLLDSMDPDGAAERFPELASDPRFWMDMALFVAFLNFLSWAGPRDPFPDIPWY